MHLSKFKIQILSQTFILWKFHNSFFCTASSGIYSKILKWAFPTSTVLKVCQDFKSTSFSLWLLPNCDLIYKKPLSKYVLGSPDGCLMNYVYEN